MLAMTRGELIEAVMGRLGETSGFNATLRLICPVEQSSGSRH